MDLRPVPSPEHRARIADLGKKARAWRRDPVASRLAVADLVEMAQAGDGLAVDAVLVYHTPHIYAMCWRLGIDKDEIDDLVQEGLIAMLEPLRRFDKERSPVLWFYARFFVRRGICLARGRQLGLSAHQATIYKSVWDAHDSLCGEDGELPPTPKAVRDYLIKERSRQIGEAAIMVVLEAGRPKRFRFDETRDSAGIAEAAQVFPAADETE